VVYTLNKNSEETQNYRKKPGVTLSWRWWVVILVFSVLAIAVIAGIRPNPSIRGESVFYDANGVVIASTAAPGRIEVPLSDMATDLRHAFVAVEDSRFYQHPGLDPVGIVRAFIRNIRCRTHS